MSTISPGAAKLPDGVYVNHGFMSKAVLKKKTALHCDWRCFPKEHKRDFNFELLYLMQTSLSSVL